MQCHQCGESISTANKFCPNCGAKIAQPEVSNPLPPIQELFTARRYCAALEQLQTASGAEADALRTEAQAGFEQVLATIIKRGSLARWAQRSFDAEQITALRDDLLKRTATGAVLSDPTEANGYTTALITRVAAQASADSEPNERERRGMIFAARALTTAQHQPAVEQLIVRYGLDQRVTGQLQIPPEAASALPSSPAPLPEESDADPGLVALEQSEAALLNNQLETSERCLREAEQLLGSDLLYQGRLKRLAAQLEVLRTSVPTLRQILAQPLKLWMADGEKLSKQSIAQFETLSQLFAPDDPRIIELRRLYDAQTAAWRAAHAKLESLPTLEGAALEAIFNELAPLLPADLPVLVAAQERLDAYRAAERARSQAEQLEATIAQAITSYLGLKARADNLYEEIMVESSVITSLRDELAAASRNAFVPVADNPVDPETFAFYDLIFANRFREINTLSEEAQTAATLQNFGELAGAYQAQINEVKRLERESDPSSRTELERAKTKLAEIAQHLQERLSNDAQETLASVEALLKNFDYTTAHENLHALRRSIKDAQISLDDALEQKLEQQEQRVAQLAAQQQQAEATLKVAEELLGQQPPDFAGALKQFDQAEQEAPWRRQELAERRTRLIERRTAFLNELLQKVSVYVRAGDERSLELATAILKDIEQQPLSESQLEALSTARDAITQQQINRNQIAQIRVTVSAIAEQTKEGKDLDEVSAQIQGLRARLGAEDSPNVPSEVWGELSALLDTAALRIGRWRRYRDLLMRAQQAALDGKADDVRTVFRSIEQELGDETYLSIAVDRKELNRLANNSSLAERIQLQLHNLLDRLIDGDSNISASAIEVVIKAARLVDDPWIVEQRSIITSEYLDLYRARDTLVRAMDQGNFIVFEQEYSKLNSDVQANLLIAQLHQQAEATRLQIEFEAQLEDLLREAKPRFNMGWEKPTEFLVAVSDLRRFADRLSPARRQETPRLAPATLGQLAVLGDILVAACSDYEARRYKDAQNRVNLARNMIPTNAITTTSMLNPYADDLGYLRGVLNSKYDDLGTEFKIYLEGTKKIEEALKKYLEKVGRKPSAFITADLNEVQREFATIDDPRSQEHINVIKRITDLLERIDRCPELFLSDPPEAQDIAARKAALEAELQAVRREAETIRHDPIGQHWLGIAENERYRQLASHTHLAELITRADHWLAHARAAKASEHSVALIDNLLQEGATLAGDLSDSNASKLADPNLGLSSIPETLSERSHSVNSGLNVLKKRRAELAGKNRNRAALYSTIALLVAFIALGAAIPRVREPVVEAGTIALIGTLTPTLTPTIDPAISAAATANAQATIIAQTPTPTLPPTLTPTPTPIPPQTALVVFPGQINVRNRPNLSLNRTSFLVANDDVILTAFSDAPDGVRWYRVDVPAKNLMGVWLLAEADNDRGQIFPTLRFMDNGGQLRTELGIAYQP